MRNSFTSRTGLAFFFSLITSVGFCQTVNGILQNKETRETIPYATVSIGDNYGVITNGDGEFTISTEAFTEKDSISFSSMGYEKLNIALKDLTSDIVYLSENINELDQVYLLDRELTVQEILQKVIQNIPVNYDNSYTEFTVFERKKSTSEFIDYDIKIKKASFMNRKTKKAFNKLRDSLLHIYGPTVSSSYRDELTKLYIGKDDSLKLEPIKATRLVNKEKELSTEKLQENTFSSLSKSLKSPYTFKLKTGILKIKDSTDLINEEKDSLEPDLVSAKNKRRNMKWLLSDNGFTTYHSDFKFIKENEDYTFEIKDVTDFNGEMVYVISFQPDKRRAKLTGEMFVSAETFAIVKADYKLAEGKEMNKVNLKLLLGVKTYMDEKSASVIYQKNKKGKYLPKFIKTHNREYMYINRPFSLTENNPNRRERIKFKFKLLIEQLSTYDGEYLFIDNNEISEDMFASFEENEGVHLEEISEYDPQLWEGYNTIAPDKAIREYK